MKQVMILVLSVISTIIFLAFPCLAEEVRGEIVKMDSSHVIVKVKGEGERSFTVTKTTSVFKGGTPCPTKHLLPHTIVRVAGRHGKAEWIFVEEAPK